MKNRLRFLLPGAIALGLIIGIAFAGADRQEAKTQTTHNGSEPQEESVVVEQHASYVQVSQQELIELADSIFEGTVLSISPTRWNQDSGDKWDGGLMLHAVEIEVDQPLVGDVAAGERFSLTILGASPGEGHVDYDFKAGDTSIFFTKRTDLTWSDGFRTVNMLIGAPAGSYLLADENGMFKGQLFSQPMSLDEVTKLIAEHRVVINQP